MKMEGVEGSLAGEFLKNRSAVEDAYKTLEKIEAIVDHMKSMDYDEFLAMCRVIVQSNYDIAYTQLKAMVRMNEIIIAKEEKESEYVGEGAD